ncbi:hypothetical protein ACFSJ3_08130 [Corallincola platygyrae]|uniref:Gamma-glutamylcyclotransferase AIG2-like domain-containing protein n=1 Tax=Corallincola platygyrae TaxID=1193278 RepID=A0ABW4XK67_9GAMM
MEILSVNEVIENLNKYAGKNVYLYGLLVWEFENECISHLPAGERKDGFNQSSIWLSCSPLLKFETRAMKKLGHKPVLVEGLVLAPDPELGGCGHLSHWPAEIVATDIERYKVQWASKV